MFIVPFSIYLLSILLFRQDSSGFSRNKLLMIIGFASLFQIILLFTDVSLSDDIYRFYYEGKGLINGVNPYVTPIQEFPNNLKDQYFAKVNNAHVTSPYPPLAVLLFASLYLFFPNPIIYRICFSLSFLVSILGCYKLIEPENKWKLVIYAWNPLLHLETANGSHFDALVVLMIIASLWCLKSEKFSLAGFFLVLGFLLKYYPILLAIIFWKQFDKRGLTIIFAGISIYSSFVLLNPSLIQGLLIYSDTWYFNASMLWIVYEILGYFLLSKILVGLAFLIILTNFAVKQPLDNDTSYRYALIIMGSFLLLQPVFHPWYFFWLFPFLIIDNRINFSWIILSGTLIFSYHVYILYDSIGIWVESNMFRMIEYIPFFIILLLEIWGQSRINQRFYSFRISKISNKCQIFNRKNSRN